MTRYWHRTSCFLSVTTYPSAGGRRGAHGCVFQERKMHRVATNMYLRKTPEKPEKVWSTNFKCERFGSCFYVGEGISTPRVRHKGRQSLIKCANMTSICFISLLHFLCLLCLLYFLSFCGRQGCFPRSYVFLNCDKEIRPT